MKTPDSRLPIGTKWKCRNKRDKTIVDILTTTNSKGEVVQIQYVSEHTFLGQKVRTKDVGTTIIRMLVQQ